MKRIKQALAPMKKYSIRIIIRANNYQEVYEDSIKSALYRKCQAAIWDEDVRKWDAEKKTGEKENKK